MTSPKQPWYAVVLFWFSWAFLALSLASGCIGIGDELYLQFKGVEPPRHNLYHLVGACSILAAWVLFSKEWWLRWKREHPEFHPPAVVHTVAGTVVKAQSLNGRFVPYGNDYAAVCVVHSAEGGPKVKNLRARIAVIRLKDNFRPVEVSEGCWMNEPKPGVVFKPDTSRCLVVFAWSVNGPIYVPHFVGRDIEKKELTDHEHLQVIVTLYDGYENVISSHYFKPVAILPYEESQPFQPHKRLGFQTQRD